MNKIENILAKKFNKKYCCLSGSGTTAIYLILKSLKMQNKKILFPAITCMAPVNAAIYAGYEPIFCDVDLHNFTMDVKSAREIIDNNDVGIIVPTHIYGNRYDEKSFENLAKENNLFLLEDAAQTYSLSYSNSSIMSFGHTKILECKNGGGAVFTNDKELLNKLREERKKIPNKPKNLSNMFEAYRNVYYSIIKEILNNKNYWGLMLELQKINFNTFVYNYSNDDEILNALNNMDEILEERKLRKELYKKFLDKTLIIESLIDEEIAWRYTFLFKGNREELLNRVRGENIDISSWYPVLYKMYSNQDGSKFKNANYIQDHVVNLWVEPKYSEKKIKDDIFVINDIMSGMKI